VAAVMWHKGFTPRPCREHEHLWPFHILLATEHRQYSVTAKFLLHRVSIDPEASDRWTAMAAS
jgi:hypothetical protein